LLREQGLLRDFKEKDSASFAPCEKRVWIRIEFNSDRNHQCGCATPDAGSTISVFAHDIVRFCSTAARGSLHVSHLIQGF
jgi:hypothetical protein